MATPTNPALATYSRKQVATDDPGYIDSKSFDPEKYFKILLRNKSIDELLKADNELRKEIKLLDGRMKTLVHNNYQKFISAADTLRKMNTNIEAMESEMAKLQSNIQRIEKYSTSISDHLTAKRTEIEQLAGVHSLLEQLHFLSEVPKKLTQALKGEITYKEAIDYYHMTHQILKKYSHIQSFNQIKNNSEKLIGDIKAAVLDKFDVQDDEKGILEYYTLALELGESPKSLRERFGISRRVAVHKALYVWKDFDITPAFPGEPLTESYKRFITKLNQAFFPPFALFVNLFTKIFVERSESDEDDVSEALDEHINGMLQQYVDLISQHLLRSGSPEVMISTINLIGFELSEAHKQHNLPRLNLAQRTDSLLTSITAALIGHHFQTFLKSFEAAITKMSEDVSQKDAEYFPPDSPTTSSANSSNTMSGTYTDIVNKSYSNFTSAVEKLVQSIKPLFLDPQAPAIIISKITTTISTMNTNMLRHRNSNDEKQLSKSFLLVVIRLWQKIEYSGINFIEEKLKPLLVAMNYNKPIGIDVKGIKENILETAQGLLEFYVQTQGERLGHMIRKSVETSNWITKKEPRDVEMIIDMIIHEVQQLQQHIDGVYQTVGKSGTGAGSGSAGATGQGGRSTPGGGGGAGIQSGIRSTSVRPAMNLGIGIFTKKMQFFGKVDFDRNSIVFGILRVSLKAFLEAIRVTTFGTHGYQQIQVNTTYMRMGLNDFVEDKQLLTLMIDELLASAEERTIEPVPMEPSIVERICSEKLKKKAS